jgi:hypothetical protein
MMVERKHQPGPPMTLGNMKKRYDDVWSSR